jgi:hypothetical protein
VVKLAHEEVGIEEEHDESDFEDRSQDPGAGAWLRWR